MSAGRFVSKLVRIGARRFQRSQRSPLWQRYRKLFLSAALPLCMIVPAWAAPDPSYVVTSTADTMTVGTLRYAIAQAVLDTANVVITFDLPPNTRLELGASLPHISKASGTLTIDGSGTQGLVIDGNDAYAAFNVQAGTVTISDLAIEDAKSVGGAGGKGYSGGGGGLGAGGAVFVNAGAGVILENVTLTGNQAVGGAGGGAHGSANFGGGGGGGMYGAAGGDAPTEGNEIGGVGGGVNGGAAGNSAGGAGGDGGDASGGGGGGLNTNGNGGNGGDGGFGGGGGAAGRSLNLGVNNAATNGDGGLGGGAGGRIATGGTGGDGLGGAIFVRSGGSLTIIDSSLSDNSSLGGVRGASLTGSAANGVAGKAAGDGIYLNNITLNVTTSAGETTSLDDTISGSGGITVSGAGTTELNAVNDFTGIVSVMSGGNLSLNNGSSLGDDANSVVSMGLSTIHFQNDMTAAQSLLLSGSDITLDTEANDVTLSGVLSGPFGFKKVGDGVLTLSGMNNYGAIGMTDISEGVVAVTADANLGFSTATVQLSGGTLRTDDDFTTARNINLMDGGGTIDNNGNDATFSGVIYNTGDLTLNGDGKTTLSGSNSFLGDVTVNGGTLSISAHANLGDATNDVYLNDEATLLVTEDLLTGAHRDFYLNGENTLDVASDKTLLLENDSRILDGTNPGVLVKAGAGTLHLEGVASHTGGTIINNGVVTVRNSDSLSGDLTINEDGAFDNFNMSTSFGKLSGSGSLKIGIDMGLGNFSEGRFTTITDASTTFDGVISGGGSFAKDGLGTLTLGGLNTFSGEFEVAGGGTLQVSKGANLGNAANTVALFENSLLLINNGGNDTTISQVISGYGNVTLNGLNGSGTTTLSGTNTFTGDVTVNAGGLSISSNANLGNSANDLFLNNGARFVVTETFTSNSGLDISLNGSNTISIAAGKKFTLHSDATIQDGDNAGSLTVGGGGILQLEGIASHTGGTVIDSAAINLLTNNALGGDLEVTQGSTLFVNGTTQTLGKLTGYGSVSLGSQGVGGDLTLDSDQDSSFYGGFTGFGVIAKEGTGTLIIEDDLQGGFDGDVNVNGGTLQIEKEFLATFTVADGATLRGFGTVGDVTIQSGGILAGGETTEIGTLNTGNLTMEDGAILNMRFSQTDTAGEGQNDYINVTGDLTIDGTLNVGKPSNDPFQFGLYRVLGYTGTLTDNGLDIGTVPQGVDPLSLEIQTSIAGQVNLVHDGTVFWNGAVTTADGTIHGGDGVWNSSNTNWTNQAGVTSKVWNENVGVFAGQAGIVTIQGEQTFVGLQFLTDGYELVAGANGSLNLAADTTSAIRVDDNVSATISAPITGTGTLVKLDSGTLAITGFNDTFTGDTELRGGTLFVGAGALGSGTLVNIGDTTDIAKANVLQLGQQVDFTNDIDLQGFLNIQVTEDFAELTGTIGGTEVQGQLNHSVLIKSGASPLWVKGTVATAGINSLEGVIDIRDQATITSNNLNLTVSESAEIAFNSHEVTAARIEGTGTIRFDNQLTFDSSTVPMGQIYEIESTLAGTGKFVKSGAGIASIDFENVTYTGGTEVQDGGLFWNVSSDGTHSDEITGTGIFGKTGEGTLTLTEDLGALITQVADGKLVLETGVVNSVAVILGDMAAGTSGTLEFANDDDVSSSALIVSAVPSSGTVIKSGEGKLTLNTTNVYSGGTYLEAGILELSTATASIGTGSLYAEGGSLQFAAGNPTFNNGIVLNEDLTINVVPSGFTTLGGAISGTGDLTFNGAGTVYLKGANTFTGDLNIDLGNNNFLWVQGASSLIGGNNVDIAGASILAPQVDTIVGQLTGSGRVALFSSTLTAGTDDDFEYGGDIANVGNFDKVGDGDMKLTSVSAALRNTGLVTVSEGSLTGNATQFNNHDIVNNATLNFEQTSNGQYSGVISGSGVVNKNGDGKLSIGGASTYTGNTTLNAGTLSFNHVDAAIGTGSLIVKGGSLEINVADGTFNLENDIVLHQDLTIHKVQTDNAVISGDISESGGSFGLTKTGPNVLILEGDNSFTGDVNIQAGSLYISSNGALDQGQNVIISEGAEMVTTGTDAVVGELTGKGRIYFLGGSVTAGNANDFTYEGWLDGSGDFVKAGTGAMTHTGRFVQSGAVTISEGKFVGTAFSLNDHDVENNAEIVFEQTDDGSYGGVISGTGLVTKNGDGELTISGANTYEGGTALNEGTLVINDGTAKLGTGTVEMNGGALQFNGATGYFFSNNIAVNEDSSIGLQNLLDVFLDGDLSGEEKLTRTGAGALWLTGDNSNFTGDIDIQGGWIIANSNTALTEGNNVNLGDETTLAAYNSSHAIIGNLTGSGYLFATAGSQITAGAADDTTFTGYINGDGTFTKAGSGSLTLETEQALASIANVEIDEGTLIGNSGSFNNHNITNNAEMIFDQATDGTFNGVISGTGVVGKEGDGTLTLEGIQTYEGATNVDGGTLSVVGSILESAVAVNDGGTLRGTGNLGDVTVKSGGAIGAGTDDDVGTLTMNTLVLEAGAEVNLRIGEANVVGGEFNDFIQVNGDLTLDGTLNLTQSTNGDFEFGSYRLMNYEGNLTDNGLELGSLPVGTTAAELQTAVDGQVNIVLDQTLFWDGSNTTADGIIQGGTGTWNSSLTNWTSPSAMANTPWFNQVGVFAGEAGTVTVEGQQTFTGLQFSTDGYNIVGGDAGSLLLGETAGIRVDQGVTASLAVSLTGDGSLKKLDDGTLVLSGDNSYSGGTTLAKGTVRAESNTALGTGAIRGLHESTLDLADGVSLENDLSVETQMNISQSVTGESATLTGDISGDANAILKKTGAGTVVLDGGISVHELAVDAGVLSLGSHAQLATLNTLSVEDGAEFDFNTVETTVSNINGTGTVRFDNTLTFNAECSATVNAELTGDGQFIKDGAGLLVLNGDASNLEGLEILQGALGLGDITVDGAISGTGELQIADATATVKGAISNQGGIMLNGGHLTTESGEITTNVVFSDGPHDSTLTFKTADDVSFDHTISGQGSVAKQGTGTLTVTHANTYTAGTKLAAGKLFVQNSDALGTGDLTVQGGELQLSTAVALGNNIVAENDVQVTVGADSSASLTGDLSEPNGEFSFTKSGDGTLTLTGTNSMTGGMTVEAGTLVGNTANLVGAITNDSELVFHQETDGEFAGTLAGAGNLTKTGSGNLNVKRQNTTTGNTTINAGKVTLLRPADSPMVEAPGHGLLSNTGNLFVGDGATLQLGEVFHDRATSADDLRGVVQQVGTLTGSGGIVLNESLLLTKSDTDSTFAGNVSGFGSFLKDGSGSLTLTGTNTHSLATGVLGGTLVLGSSTALPTDGYTVVSSGATLDLNDHSVQTGALQSAGNILLGGGQLTVNTGAALPFAGMSSDSSVSGIISGSGGLTKTGEGLLVLSGANTYTGNTTVSQGTLEVSTNSLPATQVDVFGTLLFNQNFNGAFGGVLTGDGTIGKQGTGIVELTGSSTFTGSMMVDAGQLVNNGYIVAQTTVGAGAMLSGTGTLGTTEVGGTIAPGNSIGTQTIMGDYTQNVGSTYQAEINPDGTSDLIEVTGTANIEGGTVAVSLYPQNETARFFNDQTFTILTAEAGIEGLFDEVTDSIVGFDAILLPVAYLNDLYQLQIQLQRNWQQVEASVRTINQWEVLQAVIAADEGQLPPGFADMVDELMFLQGPQARSALDSLSGSIHATMGSLAIQQTTLNLTMIADRARRNGSGLSGFAMSNGNIAPAVAQATETWNSSLMRGQSGSLDWTSGWVTGYGAGANVSSNGNAIGMDYTVGGTLFGIDRNFEDGLLGIAGNYSVMNVSGDSGSGSNNVDLFYLTAYGQKQFERAYVLAAMGYGYQGYESNRNVVVGSISDAVSANYNGNQFHSYAEVGQTVQMGNVAVTPLAGLQYVSMRRGSFTESGDLGLRVGSDGVDSLRTNLGARAAFTRTTRRGAAFSPYVQAAWMAELLEGGRVMSAQFSGTPTSAGFQVLGNDLGRHYGVFGTGFTIQPTDGVEFFLGYDAQVGRWYSLHSGMGGVQFTW